ncbi:MAG: type IV toxin-antitoxin system AbiEi family antitoxin domain-containing protein [Clostridiales bacterium]|jgi:predicted transcriptional regulator of viral defense system|nr:type IV toxin-antitoxin system AbiEi family antitoxin domain-containing protein [Eubacteriales bacterium]MDH7567647.1 type IV toxin-antitoxin system AbiEi family antitoxin domain-containing protein [Clostridiales bacterium]
MKSFKVNEIIEGFNKTGGTLTVAELKQLGLSAYNISLLVEEGTLERIRRGLYRIPEKAHEMSELLEASRSVPQGVLCLLSALSWHELTTHIPKEYSLAIPIKARKPVLPEYPPIQIYYFAPCRYAAGQMTVSVDGHPVKVYDKEKTICDLIYYRNKIGQDIVREALDKYIRTKDRNIQKLMQYAEILRVSAIMKKYLEVLI